MNTPDTERHELGIEHSTGANSTHLLKTTPDTEWESNYDAMVEDARIYSDFPDILAEHIKGYVRKEISSRDTYWEERVRKEVEGMKVEVREHYDDCDVQTGKSQRGECRCGLWRNHHRSRNQALDTLLDNLK